MIFLCGEVSVTARGLKTHEACQGRHSGMVRHLKDYSGFHRLCGLVR